MLKSTLVFSQGQAPAAPTISQEDEEVFLAAIKEKEVREQLKSSPQFKKCISSAESISDIKEKNEAIRKCMTTVIADFGDSELEQLDEKLGTGIFDKKKASTSRSLREYLGDRMSEAIYGVDEAARRKFVSLKEQNLVQHETFYKLYREQLAKNTMLHISQYCFENFGFDDSRNFVVDSETVLDKLVVEDNSNNASFSYKFDKNKLVTKITPQTKDCESTKYYDQSGEIPKHSALIRASTVENCPATYLVNSVFSNSSKLREFQICSKSKIEDCLSPAEAKNATDKTRAAYQKYRTVDMLDAMKKAEFKMAENTQDLSIRTRFQFCTLNVIHNMCEVYRCNNIYTENSSKEIIDKCKRYGITTLSDDQLSNTNQERLKTDGSKDTGAMACNIKRELENYRQMIASTSAIEEQLQKDYNALKSNAKYQKFSVAGSVGSVYQAKGGNKVSTNELTSIGSKDLIDNVSDISESEATAEKLRDLCMSEENDPNDPSKKIYVLKNDLSTSDEKKCQELRASLSSDNFENMKLDAEAQTEIYVKKINDLGNSRDQLLEFIKEEGLEGKIGANDLGNMNPDQLRELLIGHYRSEQLTQLDAIKKRFQKELEATQNAITQEEKDLKKAAEQAVAQEKLSDIAEHKRRVANLFQYSNVITSYLGLVDEKTGKESSNIVGRKLEVDNKLNEDTEAYMEYFGKGIKDENTNVNTDSYIKLIDSVISGQDKTNDKKN